MSLNRRKPGWFLSFIVSFLYERNLRNRFSFKRYFNKFLYLFMSITRLRKCFLVLGISLFFFSFFFIKKSFIFSLKVFQKFRGLELDFLVLIDWISILFFSVLLIIVTCVLKFSYIYVGEDNRFTSILLLFVISMTCLIFFPRFIFLLIGWDGLGITSFLLIIYYYSSSSWSAGLKTYLINRLGDCFLVLRIRLLFFQGHWKILSFDYSVKVLLLIRLILGFFTKRAIYPFSRWLPAAMAAPTPVSALVHSSTLVTAGIYLIIRFKYFFPKWVFFVFGVLGLLTLFIARFAACLEWDSKKIIAFSTLSQLGLMLYSLSLGLNLFCFFHLLTHAVFKALLFICVGYYIHLNLHNQDIRLLKNLWKFKPICRICVIICVLALSGFPFLSGFFSKDVIIESNLFCNNSFFFVFFLFSLVLTSYYRFRLVKKVLSNKNLDSKINICKEKEFKIMSIFPLVILSIFLGCLIKNFLFIKVFPSLRFKVILILLIFIGWGLSKQKSYRFKWFFSKISFLIPLKSRFVNNNFTNVGVLFFKNLDQGWFYYILSKLVMVIKFKILKISSVVYIFFSPRFFFYFNIIFFFIIITSFFF